ncbi:hypothetical protein CSB09_01725 [Candidatus Gracilibacteria bacterium]|nr:MAG: hypothetical protein CSB09_01725 [Candidatus Gracilibacteria bacterium]
MILVRPKKSSKSQIFSERRENICASGLYEFIQKIQENWIMKFLIPKNTRKLDYEISYSKKYKKIGL